MRAFAVLMMLSSTIPFSTTARSCAQSPTDDVQDLVYLASDRPVFIRLHIRVLGEGFRGLREVYARRLHHSLDADGDGVLNESETRNIPPSDQLLPPRGPQEELRSFNPDPVDANADGTVTLAELTDYVRKSSGPPFDFRLAPPLHAGQLDLFEVVDENSDGTLDRSEIESAAHSLLKLDANADEIVDQSELSIGGRRYFGGGSGSESAELFSTLLVVDPETDDAADALFDKLVDRYDRPDSSRESISNKPSGDGRLDAGELGVSRDRLAKWDTDSDGMLAAREGRDFILNSFPDLEISMSLGTEDSLAVVQSTLSADGALAKEFSATPGLRGNLQLTMGRERFELSLGACPAPPVELRRKYEQNFHSVDGDGNEYLDMTEIRQLGILPAHHSAVDRNADRMVRKEELIEYIELQSWLFVSRVVLLLAQEAQAIFDLLNDDDDKLGLRELRQAPTKLLSWDLDGDGRIAPDERPANSRLILQNGETVHFRWNQFRGRTSAPDTHAVTGPNWFDHMDRNCDGDVSPREFLGRMEVFYHLDTNADGLISADEARKTE